MPDRRSSSTVRNLRALFEGNDTGAERPGSTTSERSSIGGEGDRVSRIRASFVSVQRPSDRRSTIAEHSTMDGQGSEAEKLQDAKVTTEVVGNDAQHSEADVKEGEIVKRTTVSIEPPNGLKDASGSTRNTTGEQPKTAERAESEVPTTTAQQPSTGNPDKPVSLSEEEPGQMKPADPTSAATVDAITPSGPPSATKKPSRTSMPGQQSAAKENTPVKSEKAKTPSKTSKAESPSKLKAPDSKPSLKLPQKSKLDTSPATKLVSPKSSRRPTTSDSKSTESSHKASTPSKLPSRPPRSSLTAQTASSAARAKTSAPAATNGAAGSHESLPIRTKKEATRPVRLSSHLTAPTASFAAKHESSKMTAGTSATETKGPAQATKSGLQRSNSTSTRSSARLSKHIQPDEGFLARMMRPTAASRAHAHEVKPVATSTKSAATARPRAGTDGKLKPPATRKDHATSSKLKESVPTKSSKDKSDSTPTTNGNKESTPAPEEGNTILDASIAGLATPGGAEATIR